MSQREPTQKELAHINRIIGQAKALKGMLENKRSCEEVVQQISAVRASLAKLGFNMLHSESLICGQDERRRKLMETVFKFK